MLDVTLADEHGHVAVEIEGYVVKAVDPRVLKGTSKSDAGASPLERWIEHGILADEGFDLLGRIVAQTQEAQVLVSPLDLHTMIAELRTPERPGPSHAADRATSGPTHHERAERSAR